MKRTGLLVFDAALEFARHGLRDLTLRSAADPKSPMNEGQQPLEIFSGRVRTSHWPNAYITDRDFAATFVIGREVASLI